MSTVASPGARRCANIGPRQRMRRVWLGSALLALAVAWAVWLLYAHAERTERLTLFFPLLGGFICLFEVREWTCVLLAAQGLRDLDDGAKPVTDPGERELIGGQTRRVFVHSIVVALAITLLYWLA